MNAREQFERDFAALPPWTQKMVRALIGSIGWGIARAEALGHFGPTEQSPVYVFIAPEHQADWSDGIQEMRELAGWLTAPKNPKPPRQITQLNRVELVAETDACAWDQPCAFGHRVDDHAVYCHHAEWTESPRKCRRGRSSDYRHEDCPGFLANPRYEKK